MHLVPKNPHHTYSMSDPTGALSYITETDEEKNLDPKLDFKTLISYIIFIKDLDLKI